MLTAIAILVVVVVALLAFAATKPDLFAVQRSRRIPAPADRIAPLISDFHRWSTWSPYEKLDPNMKRTYGGPGSGVGATYDWEGNGKVGKGRMEILDSSPSNIRIQFDMWKPIEGHNIVEFALAPTGDATNVTWSMRGKTNFIAKVMGIFVNMDNLVGRDFEKGLANIESVVRG